MSWALVVAIHAQKEAQKLAASGLKAKAQTLLDVLRDNPFQNPPPFEKLVGDLAGTYSRRINIQHRLVYQVLEAEVTDTVTTSQNAYACALGGPQGRHLLICTAPTSVHTLAVAEPNGRLELVEL